VGNDKVVCSYDIHIIVYKCVEQGIIFAYQFI